MKNLVIAICLVFFPLFILADTPPPGTVKLKGGTTGDTIGDTSGSLNVYVQNPGGGTGTSNQGSPNGGGSNSWWVQQYGTWSFNLPALASTSTLQTQIDNDLNSFAAANHSDLLGISSDLGSHLSSIDSKTPSLGQALSSASVPVVLPLSQLTTLTPLSSIGVNNFPSTQAVSGTVAISSGSVSVSNFPSTQPVSGSVSVSNLPSTQPVSGTVAVSNLPSTLGQKTSANSTSMVLASDQSAIPITGTVSATNPSVGTDGSAAPTSSTQIGASDGTNLQPLQVDGSKNLKVNVQNSSIPVTGTFYQATQPVSGSVTATISGTPAVTVSSGSVTATQATGTNLHTVVDSGAVTATISGTPTVTSNAGTGTFTVGQATGTNLHTVVDSGAVTATISGTPNVAVTSSALPSGGSTSALQTSGNTSLTSIATSTANIPSKGAATTANSLPVNIASDQTVPVSGSVTATISGTPTVTSNAGTGTFTVGQATGTNLHTVVDSSALPSNAATSTLQTTGNTSLSTIATNTTGLATASAQTTGNSSLSTIATNTTGLATASAQSTGNGSLATIATNTTGVSTAANQTSQITQETTTASNTTSILANQTNGSEKTQVVSTVPSSDFIVSGTMGSSGAIVTENVSGIAEGVLSIVGTFVGSINIQCVYPGNVTSNLTMLQATLSPPWSTAAVTAPGNYKFTAAAGCPKLQAVYTTYTSGSPTVTIDAGNAIGNPRVYQTNSAALAAGSWYNNSGVQIQGTADSSGNQNVNVVNTPSVTVSGTPNVAVTSSALPSGAASATNQASEIGYLTTIAANTGTAATDFTSTGNITAACTTPTSCSAGTNVSVTGQGVYTVTASITGSWVGTVVFEGQTPDLNWTLLPANIITSTLPYSQTPTATANGTYGITGGGFLNIRARASAYTSGTIAVSLDGSLSQQTIIANINTPDYTMTGAAAQTATVNNILFSPSGTTPYNALGFHSGSVQVNSTGTGGTYIFEGSNDGTNFVTMPVYNQLVTTGTPVVAAVTASATNIIYTFPIQFSYIRLRIATTITGGSIQAISRFSQVAWSNTVTQVAQATAGSLNTTATIASGTVTTVTTVGTASLAANANVADLASTAKTATFTLVITPASGSLSQAFQLNVTAVSGTSPTMDCSIMESLDGGTTYPKTVYTFERVTAVLSAPIFSPLIRHSGNKFEYSCVIGGTTPSFTMALNRVASMLPSAQHYKLFDRTMSPTVTTTPGTTWFTEGCTSGQLTYVQSAASGEPTLTFETSPDASNWATTTSTIVPTGAGTFTVMIPSMSAKYSRIATTTAGTGVTYTYSELNCTGP